MENITFQGTWVSFQKSLWNWILLPSNTSFIWVTCTPAERILSDNSFKGGLGPCWSWKGQLHWIGLPNQTIVLWEAYDLRSGLSFRCLAVSVLHCKGYLFWIVFKDWRIMVLVMRNWLENFLTVVVDVRLTKQVCGMQGNLAWDISETRCHNPWGKFWPVGSIAGTSLPGVSLAAHRIWLEWPHNWNHDWPERYLG